MNPYKLKHKPTGLYYQPHKHRGSHLSKKGKIYQSSTNGLSCYFRNADYYKKPYSEYNVRIRCEYDSVIYKSTQDILNWVIPEYRKNQISGDEKYYGQVSVDTKLSDWIIEEI